MCVVSDSKRPLQLLHMPFSSMSIGSRVFLSRSSKDKGLVGTYGCGNFRSNTVNGTLGLCSHVQPPDLVRVESPSNTLLENPPSTNF